MSAARVGVAAALLATVLLAGFTVLGDTDVRELRDTGGLLFWRTTLAAVP